MDCHLCGDPITVYSTGRWRFSWDHVVPRAAGGSDDLWNLQPAHLGCNIRRGDTPLRQYRVSGPRSRAAAPPPAAPTRPAPRPCLVCGQMIDAPKNGQQLVHNGDCARRRSNELQRGYARRAAGKE